MRRRTAIAVALAVLVLAGPWTPRIACAGPAAKVADAEYPAEFKARVRKAIDQGVKFLRTQQLEIGSESVDLPGMDKKLLDQIGQEFEEAAAVTWVLRRAGIPADDPAFATAAKRIRARPPKTVEEATLLVLALSAPALPEGNPFQLEEAPKGAPTAPALSKEDRDLVNGAVKYILSRQVKAGSGPLAGDPAFDESGGWGNELGGLVKNEGSDVPTTYLALLGLESAARCGVAVAPKVYLAACDLLVRWQAQKGPSTTLKMNEVRGTSRSEWTVKAQARGFGWCGSLSDAPSGYETVAGALGLIVCQDALQKDGTFAKSLRKKTQTGIRDALAWLQQFYDITKNPTTGKERTDIEGPLYHHHWLQGLARVGVHARMRFIGTHDWFQEGAEVLVKSQQGDGSWDAIWWSNCYGLLFLMRASLPSTVPVVTESEPGK
jgi:hypothetical protein